MSNLNWRDRELLVHGIPRTATLSRKLEHAYSVFADATGFSPELRSTTMVLRDRLFAAEAAAIFSGADSPTKNRTAAAYRHDLREFLRANGLMLVSEGPGTYRAAKPSFADGGQSRYR